MRRRETFLLPLAAMVPFGGGMLLPAAAAAAETMRLAPNPAGALDALWAVTGDPIAGTPVAPFLPAAASGTRRRVRLLHFNDLHNYLTSPHAVRGDTHAFGQMVELVRAARAAAGPEEIVLFTSSGDDQTGGVMDELLGFGPAEMIVHPAYQAFAVAGVDAMALGNHEFDRGTALLREALRRHPAVPALSANIHGAVDLPPGAFHHPAVIGLAKGLRIGLIGLTTAEDTRVGTPENPGLAVASPLAVASRLLPVVAEASDLVVILSHLGYGAGFDRSGKAGAERAIGEGDTAIAEAAVRLTDKTVVILGGHTHTVLNAEALEPRNLLDGRVVIAQAGSHGSHLGEVVVELEVGKPVAREIGARLRALERADRRIPADDPKARTVQQPEDVDQAFQEIVMAPMLARLDKRLGAVIGEVEAGPEVTTERTIQDRYLRETAIANLMNDLMVARSAEAFPDGAVDIAVFNATGLVAGIPPKGPITFSDWFAVMPFTDSVQIFELTGSDLEAILASNAQRIVRPEELEGANAVDLKGYVSRGFLHFSRGLRYRIALGSGPAQARAVDIEIQGRPLAEVRERRFRVLFGSYIGHGGVAEAWNGREIAGLGGIRGYDLTRHAKRDTGFVYRNEVVAQIRKIGVIRPEHGARLDGRLVVSA